MVAGKLKDVEGRVKEGVKDGAGVGAGGVKERLKLPISEKFSWKLFYYFGGAVEAVEM